jgi:hypothetical protein
MSRRMLIAFSVIIISVVLASSVAVWYNATKRGNGIVIEKPANVKSIKIIILESFPVQVNVIVYGEFPDSCTEICNMTMIREGSTFIITIITRRPSDVVCAQVITPFERVVPLDVVGLRKGVYTVDVNGLTDTFELYEDNIVQNVGFLEGKVEIGPLCPVESCNFTQEQMASLRGKENSRLHIR